MIKKHKVTIELDVHDSPNAMATVKHIRHLLSDEKITEIDTIKVEVTREWL
jgi:hypothetical protein